MKQRLTLFLAAGLTAGAALAQPVIVLQPADQAATNGGSATFTVAAAGAGPFTYQWQLDGTNLPNGIITTVAGNTGNTGYSGDGGPAVSAELNFPSGVTVDGQGNLLIADTGNSRIRAIGLNHTISALAGNASATFAGDGGAATNATLNNPGAVALDSLGNLYIADTGNNRVREVNFAGSPTLSVNQAAAKNAGSYQVIITSSFGSITSSIAPLVVVSRPVVAKLAANPDGSVTLNLLTTTNISSRLYVSTNLVPPVVWQPIGTNVNGGTWQFLDTTASGAAAKFYQLSTP